MHLIIYTYNYMIYRPVTARAQALTPGVTPPWIQNPFVLAIKLGEHTPASNVPGVPSLMHVSLAEEPFGNQPNPRPTNHQTTRVTQ